MAAHGGPWSAGMARASTTRKNSEDPADYVGSAAFLESDTDLVRETVTQISAVSAYRANSKVLRARSEMLEDLANLGL